MSKPARRRHVDYVAQYEAAMSAPVTEYGEDETPIEPYRDGKIHVMSEKCSTCVFHPGNRMNLAPGRLKAMTDDVQATGVPFSCHQTLPYSDSKYAEHYDGAALCAGAVETYGDESVILMLARAQGIIEEVEPYEE